jgi:hypothetical protein
LIVLTFFVVTAFTSHRNVTGYVQPHTCAVHSIEVLHRRTVTLQLPTAIQAAPPEGSEDGLGRIPHIEKGQGLCLSRLADLLSWKHSGFNIHDGGEKPVPAHDTEGRKRLAEYLLRHPFSLQKITWNATTQTVIYRSKRHHTTKRNFEIFKTPAFIAAVIDHLPPKGKQTVRYYGLYSNKTRGRQSLIPDRIIRPPESSPDLKSPISNLQSEILLVPAPPKQSAKSMRPLWRDMILKVWGADPLQCPCCKAPMKLAGAVKRPEQIEFFLRLHGLWEGIIQLPRPPPPPFDIKTMEPIEPPWQAIKEWIPDDEPDLDWFNRPRNPDESDPDWFDQTQVWKPEEIQLDDGRTLVLEYT